MALVAASVVAAACGSAHAPLVEPASVPKGLVPAALADGVTVNEYAPARARFARAGASSLVADGRVWAIRKGPTLIGTLQVSTVKPDVDLSTKNDRASIIEGVMTGARYETLYVGDTKVLASSAADRNVYLWFGRDLFEVLQVKGSKVDPDSVAADLLEFQQAAGFLDAEK